MRLQAKEVYPPDMIEVNGEPMEVTGRSTEDGQITFELDSGAETVTYPANKVINVYEV